jgi:Heterokaryon incompatibility protein (HET)
MEKSGVELAAALVPQVVKDKEKGRRERKGIRRGVEKAARTNATLIPSRASGWQMGWLNNPTIQNCRQSVATPPRSSVWNYQNSDKERSRQIPKISKIYTAATRVLVWLDPETRESK